MPHQLPSVTSWDNCQIHWPVWNQNKTNTASKKLDTYHISNHVGQWTLTHVCKHCDTCGTCTSKATKTHDGTSLARLLQLPQMQSLSAQDEFKKTETSKRIRADSRHHDKCFSSTSFLPSSYRHSWRSSCHLPAHPCPDRAAETWVYTWKQFCRDIKQLQL